MAILKPNNELDVPVEQGDAHCNLNPSGIRFLGKRPNLGPNIYETKHDRDKLIDSVERWGQYGQAKV